MSLIMLLVTTVMALLCGTAMGDFDGFGTGVGGYCIKGGDSGQVWGVNSLDDCYRRCHGSPAECDSFVWGWGKCFHHPYRCDYQQLQWLDSGYHYYQRRQGPTSIGQSGESFYYNPVNNNDWGNRRWNRWYYRPFNGRRRHYGYGSGSKSRSASNERHYYWQ